MQKDSNFFEIPLFSKLELSLSSTFPFNESTNTDSCSRERNYSGAAGFRFIAYPLKKRHHVRIINHERPT